MTSLHGQVRAFRKPYLLWTFRGQFFRFANAKNALDERPFGDSVKAPSCTEGSALRRRLSYDRPDAAEHFPSRRRRVAR